MKYVGSKNRHAKELLPIILKDRRENQYYIEPFVGGFNMIDKVKGMRIANDSNYYLIELFKAVQSGWVPPKNISEEEYKNARLNKTSLPPHLVGFIGFCCSYSGKFFGGFARGEGRNYADESSRNLLKQAENIKGVEIYNKSYVDLYIPKNSIIYCDPPYQGTTKYKDEIDYTVFWDWVREKSKEGHKVFVSEYNAPIDFICVWSKEVNNTLVQNTGSKKGIEKLFISKYAKESK